jgi:hypothetical protein
LIVEGSTFSSICQSEATRTAVASLHLEDLVDLISTGLQATFFNFVKSSSISSLTFRTSVSNSTFCCAFFSFLFSLISLTSD